MFSWLIDPSKSFAEGMEIAFAVGLFLTTLAVVLGLIGEYRDGPWWKRNLHVFEMMVVLGVAGEMVTETGAFWYSLRLQAIEGLEIVNAQQRANDAAIEAGKLGVKVDKLPTFVTQKEHELSGQVSDFKVFAATKKVEFDNDLSAVTRAQNKLEMDVKDAHTAAIQSDIDIKKLEDLLAEQRALTADIKQLTAQRHLKDAQIAQMILSLPQYRLDHVELDFGWSTRECTTFANQLLAALNAVFVASKRPLLNKEVPFVMFAAGAANDPTYPDGVTINWYGGGDSKQYATELARLLNADGIAATASAQPLLPGEKPLAYVDVHVGAIPNSEAQK